MWIETNDFPFNTNWLNYKLRLECNNEISSRELNRKKIVWVDWYQRHHIIKWMLTKLRNIALMFVMKLRIKSENIWITWVKLLFIIKRSELLEKLLKKLLTFEYLILQSNLRFLCDLSSRIFHFNGVYTELKLFAISFHHIIM